MPERACPPWCVERHPERVGADEHDEEVWLHRSPATQIDMCRDRDVLRSEWTTPAIEVRLASVEDPAEDTSFPAVIEVGHGGVILTLTADEARQLASALEQHAERLDTVDTRRRLRRRPGHGRAG